MFDSGGTKLLAVGTLAANFSPEAREAQVTFTAEGVLVPGTILPGSVSPLSVRTHSAPCTTSVPLHRLRVVPIDLVFLYVASEADQTDGRPGLSSDELYTIQVLLDLFHAEQRIQKAIPMGTPLREWFLSFLSRILLRTGDGDLDHLKKDLEEAGVPSEQVSCACLCPH